MEFTNEIFFNKPLKANSTVIITYSGKLYREHSQEVSIVYGYGDNWEETDSSKMVETETGFEVTLTIKDYNTFNFCFCNTFNIWDNNYGFNYISPILPKDEDNQEKDDDKLTKDGLDNLETASTSPVEVSEEKTEEEQEENSEEANDKPENFEAEFANLLDSILDDTNKSAEPVDISNLSGFGLQAVDEIQEEVNCDELFAEMFDELTSEETKEETVEAETNVENEAESEEEVDPYEELDSLMDNLLYSISEKAESTKPIQEITPVEEIKDEEIENSELPAVQRPNEDWLDKIINISYSVTKKFTTACKKFGQLVKLKVKELGFLNDDEK